MPSADKPAAVPRSRIIWDSRKVSAARTSPSAPASKRSVSVPRSWSPREGIRGEIVAGKGVAYLDDGTKIIARASVCATGVDYRRLGLPNEDRFLGAGVYYGAGASEAMLCGSQEVFLVGGGNSAGQAALHFARYAARVNMVVREDALKAYMSDYLIDRIRDEPKINVLINTEVTALHGDLHFAGDYSAQQQDR